MDMLSYILGLKAGSGSGGDSDTTNIKIAKGQIQNEEITASTDGTVTVTHGLGVIPDIFVMMWVGLGATSSGNIPLATFMTSQSFQDAVGTDAGLYLVYRGANGSMVGLTVNKTIESTNVYGIQQVTKTSAVIGGTSYPLDTAGSYYWIAIGGLT